ncbi:MAG: FixH family protein [Pseudobdellovibrionaceae bacterium]
MFDKKIFSVLVILLTLIACARPNYSQVSPGNGDNSNSNNSDSNQNQKVTSPTECHLPFLKEKLCVELVWNNIPSDSEYGSFDLKFFEAERPQVAVNPGHEVGITLWMPKMGHGSGPVKITNVSEGIYKIDQVYFVMPGQWQIRIQLKGAGADSVIDQVIQEYTF